MSCKGSPRESPGLMVHRHGWDMLKLIQLLVDFDDIFSFGLRFASYRGSGKSTLLLGET